MREYYNKIYRKTKELFLKEIKLDILKGNKGCIVTANPEIFMYADQLPEVRKLLLSTNTKIIADGIGIVIGGKYFGCEIEERIPGVEICGDLLKWANEKKCSLFLFGAKPEVVKKLSEKVKYEYPDICLKGYEDGYVENKDAVFEKILRLEPDIILVALGAPLQEELIYKHIGTFNKGIFIGVGGSFDVLSGNKKKSTSVFCEM